jgi:L-ascorbate metabolism protein UlaG (beta-lactamase superfamily)
VNEIGSVDVGRFFTIGPEQAREVMESLKPKVAVPMHYRKPGMRRLVGTTFTVSKADLPEKRVIIVPRLR